MAKTDRLCKLFMLVLCIGMLAACSTNPATGKQDFTLFVPESSENSLGAQEHEKIISEYGVLDDPVLQGYVNGILSRLTPHTERKDVRYTLTILDDPIVNAFALPGGYLYITRGLLAAANDEAELAAVIAHEIGHVTARHAASRISKGTVTGLGAAILANVLNVPGAGQVLGLGSDLYLSAYSRGQEHEADMLGVRYTSRAGYDPFAMSRFLQTLELSGELEKAKAKAEGKKVGGFSYFSTHPITAERIEKSSGLASGEGQRNRTIFLGKIRGLTYGDSAKQGYVHAGRFVHPELGFAFDVPADTKVKNNENDVVLTATKVKDMMSIFDMGRVSPGQSTRDYLERVWMVDKTPVSGSLQSTSVNGMEAATALYRLPIDGKSYELRLMAVRWSRDTVYRFVVAMPRATPQAAVEEARRMTYSLRRLSAAEIKKYGPTRIALKVARSGDTVQELAARFPFDDGLNEMRFKVLNGIQSGQLLQAGRVYKIIVQ